MVPLLIVICSVLLLLLLCIVAGIIEVISSVVPDWMKK